MIRKVRPNLINPSDGVGQSVRTVKSSVMTSRIYTVCFVVSCKKPVCSFAFICVQVYGWSSTPRVSGGNNQRLQDISRTFLAVSNRETAGRGGGNTPHRWTGQHFSL